MSAHFHTGHEWLDEYETNVIHMTFAVCRSRLISTPIGDFTALCWTMLSAIYTLVMEQHYHSLYV